MKLHPSFSAFRKIVIETLISLGWSCPARLEDIPYITFCVGGRKFKTLAGERAATVWFSPWFECMGSLSGEYTTEGRNVLSTTRFNMNADMTPEQVVAMTTQFSKEALDIINGTAMIRAMNCHVGTSINTTLTVPRVSNHTTLKS